MNENNEWQADGERPSSPEQLNDYIKVTTPSVWVVLCALVLLLCAALVWSLTTNVQTTVTVWGMATDGNIACFTNNNTVSRLSLGLNAEIEGQRARGKITYIAPEAISRNEAVKRISGGAAYSLLLSEENYIVFIEAPGVDDGFHEIKVVLNAVKPISFVLN